MTECHALWNNANDVRYKEWPMDIFEQLKDKIGCKCISDLRFEPYSTKAKNMLKELDIEQCSLAELNDLAFYFYQKRFEAADAAISFLKG